MKDTVKRIKRQATDWEKLFEKYTYGKGLLPKIYRKFLQLKRKQMTLLKKKKWVKNLNISSKDDINMANSLMKRHYMSYNKYYTI